MCDTRAAGDGDRLQTFATELIALQPGAVLAVTNPGVAALSVETHTIPLVFTRVSDRVGDGFVSNLANPGGNVTGFMNLEPSIIGKWLQLLKEVAPRVVRVSLMFNPATAPGGGSNYVRLAEAAAPSVGVQVSAAKVHDVGDIERGIAAIAREANGALITLPDVFLTVHRELIVEQVSRYRVPAIYQYRYFATSGGLISYGTDVIDQYTRAAEYIDRILKGAKPADLPVQQPIKFEMAINLKAAKALGITMPDTLPAVADEVIE
jgi:putative tryptophan/tyrosine transport system substrate-binding protein